MLRITWSKRKCFIKSCFGVSDIFYQSTDLQQTVGLGQGSTAASNVWCIVHGILMHKVATYFIGIILISVSNSVQHKIVGEGLIDDTRLAVSVESSTEINPSRNKYLSLDEAALFIKMQKILHFFLELLQVGSGDRNILKCA
jgi:hypothetical protein